MTVGDAAGERAAQPKQYYDLEDASRRAPPGEFPYTRGLREQVYGSRLWTMRQYSGYATAEQTNARFRYLLQQGQTGLSTAFDLPTQMGFDSDAPQAKGEVGRVGVAIDTLADMEELFREIPLDRVSTSMTINATAACLLLLYQLVGERQGVEGRQLSGTVQNDILKEYAARGTYIYPPQASMRLVTDLLSYASREIPSWNTISISGYHIREAGSTAAQELGFTFANAIAYVEAARDAGMQVDDFAPRLSFFFNVHNNLLEEVAKFRAAREIWATIMRERFAASNPRSLMLRFHAQTAGSTLTAQQPLNNVVRVSLQALAAVLGGAQSLHTNSYDEALALPTEDAATLALRTQQIIGYESGVPPVSDPVGGSYYLEHLTDRLMEEAQALIQDVDEQGGAVAVIESGWMQEQIEQAAYEAQRAVDDGSAVVVGVNRFVQESASPIEILRQDPEVEARQIDRLNRVRRERDSSAVEHSLRRLAEEARCGGNLLYPMKEALAAYASIGEVSDALRSVFGTYHGE
ncbi:MAG TPA: methylmalonyl-CoA mutase family protein [Chloroflexota bacterium]|nr:methylmalonyl-CoA mutase family protein [Chloroflexota bacterium]